MIRGDGSDRTVEAIFAWLSGGQAPAPAFIAKQSYTAWQIVSELPLTFWGNPIVRPYPLNWFVVTMTLFTIAAGIGLILAWRSAAPGSPSRRNLLLLLLFSALPLPFMFIRLFGARDVLEAVQGRHILFLAGPAVAVLLVLGFSVISDQLSVISDRLSDAKSSSSANITPYVLRNTPYILLAVLLSGAFHQLIFMRQTYPALLPVQTTPYGRPVRKTLPTHTLPGGTRLVDYHLIAKSDEVLQVVVVWEGGESPPPEDYQLELALLDKAGADPVKLAGISNPGPLSHPSLGSRGYHL